MGQATELAKYALVQAKRSDAMDDVLYPCKLCGSSAKRVFCGADESMHRGYALVRCNKDVIGQYSCGQEVKVKPIRGDCGDAEEAEVFRRWQILNKPEGQT